MTPDVADRNAEDVGQLGPVNGSGTKLKKIKNVFFEMLYKGSYFFVTLSGSIDI